MSRFASCSCLGVVLLLGVPGGSLSFPAQASGGVAAGAGVNLKCTIIGDPNDSPRAVWIVELLTAAGVPLRQARQMAGDTVHFKDLEPGVYRIMLSGTRGRIRVQSIDLTPPSGAKGTTFKREFKVPPSHSHNPGTHLVNLQQLAVPASAAEQMKRAANEQLGGNEDKMVSHLKQAIDIYENYAQAWNDLGAYFHRKGDVEQAILIFSKVTQMDPELAAGWCNLGACLLSAERFDQAVEASRKALNLAPDDAVAAMQLALSYYYLRNTEEAKRYFRLAFELDPAFPNSPQLFLAHLALAEGSFDEAEDYFKSYLKYHPNLPAAAGVRKLLQSLTAGTLTTEVISKQ